MLTPSSGRRSAGEGESPNESSLHHYVPQGYLAAFTDTGRKKGGALWVHSRASDKPPFRTGLRRVAAEHGLHPTDEFERSLAEEIEAPFIGWQRRVIHGPRLGLSGALELLTPDEAVRIAQFVMVQQLRTPAERSRSKQLGDLAFEEHMDRSSTRAAIAEFYNERFAPKEPMTRRQRKAALDDFLARSREVARFLIDLRRHQWLSPLGRFATSGVPLLLDREWRLVELPEDVAARYPLITCDDPVVLVRPRRAPLIRGRRSGPGWDVALGGGWNEPGMQATLTLSPRHALLMSRDSDAFALADNPEEFARAVRVRTARSATDWVFARDRDEAVLEILRTSPRPSTQLVVGGIPFGPEADARAILNAARRIGVDAIEVRRAG